PAAILPTEHEQVRHVAEEAASAAAARSASGATPVAASGPAKDIVFIDTGLADWQKLASAAAASGATVVTLDPSVDGLAQVDAVLAGQSGLRSIQFLTHGEAGRINLGQTVLTGGVLAEHSSEIAAWGGTL